MPSRIRTDDFAQKKGISYFAGVVKEGTDVQNGQIPGAEAGSYHVANLPDNALILNAQVFTKTASDSTTKTATLGTASGGAQIMTAANLTLAGAAGGFVGVQDTGTGVELWLNIANGSADGTDVGEYVVYVEYLEYNKNTGEYTNMREAS